MFGDFLRLRTPSCLIVAVVSCFAATSCDRTEVIADPKSAKWESYEPQKERFESLSFGVGSGLHGLDLTVIRADRTISAKRQSTSGWQLFTGKLSEPEVALLMKGLRDTKVLSLESKYISPLADGTQICFVLITTDGTKCVYASNVELRPLREIEKLVDELSRRSLEGNQAPLSNEDSRAMEAPVWSAIEK